MSSCACSGPVGCMSTSSGYARAYTHAHACTAFCRQIRFEKNGGNFGAKLKLASFLVLMMKL